MSEVQTSTAEQLHQRKVRQNARKFERTRMSNSVEEKRLRATIGLLTNQHVLRMLDIRQQTTELKAELRLGKFRELKSKISEQSKIKGNEERTDDVISIISDSDEEAEVEKPEPRGELPEVKSHVVTFELPEVDNSSLDSHTLVRRAETALGFPSQVAPPSAASTDQRRGAQSASLARLTSRSADVMARGAPRERIHNMHCPNQHYKRLKENENRMEENKKPLQSRLLARPMRNSKSRHMLTQSLVGPGGERDTFSELLRFRAAAERQQFSTLVSSVSRFSGHEQVPRHIRFASSGLEARDSALWEYMRQQPGPVERPRPTVTCKPPQPPVLPMIDAFN